MFQQYIHQAENDDCFSSPEARPSTSCADHMRRQQAPM
jgi:hypothetical protein